MWEFLATINERIKENRRVALRDGRRPPVDIERRNQAEALENVLKLLLLEVQHKLPRWIVMTRWLSSMDAVKVMATGRETISS